MKISLNEVISQPERWVDTSYLRQDSKTEYREKKEYGNRHAIFKKASTIGIIHTDKYNATNFPVETVRHFSKYIEEKTGMPEIVTSIAIGVLVVYVGYRALK